MFKLIRTNSDHADYLELVKLLDADLKIRDGADHAFFAQYNKSTDIRNVVLCYVDNTPAGCGAFKFFQKDIVEIKRMFVLDSFRKKGIASVILEELEKWAVELNYSNCILETGKKQPEAIALYLKNNYRVIPNYGQYAQVENSVCMKKKVGSKQ